ncbi:MAG: S8 family serine peptidase [Anaerolineae bacterium]|nr:S8 family serine peptidase [Anaerolineae bacterium]
MKKVLHCVVLFGLATMVLAGFSVPGEGAGFAPVSWPADQKASTPTVTLMGSAQGQENGSPIRLRTATFVPAQGESLKLPSFLTISGYPEGQAGPYIVQFKGPIQGEWKETVDRTGAVILDYVPDFAFVVYMDDATRAVVEELPEVVWIGLYQPAYKLSLDLAEAGGVLDLVVQTFPIESVEHVRTQIQVLDVEVLDVSTNDLGGLLHLSCDASDLVTLARLPAVRWIEPLYERVIHNDAARSDTIMRADTIWSDLGLYGEGQVVAVSDTGLDTGNLSTLAQDFLGTPTGCSGTGRIVATFALGATGDWSDSCRCRYMGTWYSEGGHGTHVAGSVLGNGCRSGSSGTPDYGGSHAGLAPQAGLVFQSIMGNRGGQCMTGGCGLTGLPSDLNTLFSQAQTAGAHIHTNSWGAAVAGQYTTDSQNTDLYMWNHKDYTILFSAGNSGTDANSNGVIDLDSIGAPGTAKNCITIGASENYRLYGGVNPEHSGDPWDEGQCTGTPGCPGATGASWGNCWPDDFGTNPVCSDRISNEAGGVVAFSSRGPTDDGRIKPDVIAPGSNILSTKSQGAYISGGWGPGENQYYQFMGGTSMSTPLTAGGVALIREFFTDQGLVPSSALIKATLIHGATDLYPGQYGTGSTQEISTPRPNNVEGWGRVNLVDSLLGASPRQLEYWDYYDGTLGKPGLRTGEYDTWRYEVTDGSVPFRSTLVWTDYPGSTLQNDLDLTVTDPGSTVHYPNRGSAADRTNNVEGIDLLNPISTGVYTVRVQAYNVPQSGMVPRQAYAVVDSGATSAVTWAESRRNMSANDQLAMVFGKTDATMDFASGPGGNVTITMSKTEPAHSPPAGKAFLDVNWDISSGMSGFSTQIVFHYDETDLPAGMTENTIIALRWNSGTLSWDEVGGTVDTNANTVTVSGVTAFSNWALGGDSPTAVTLTRFEASPAVEGIHVEWETATEIDQLGFNLYRGDTSGRATQKLNEVLIASQAPGSPTGAVYAWTDKDVEPGVTYYYELEDVDFYGTATRHGPVEVTAAYVVYLPVLMR